MSKQPSSDCYVSRTLLDEALLALDRIAELPGMFDDFARGVAASIREKDEEQCDELERLKDNRASLNALTNQFNAVARARLQALNVEDLYRTARDAGLDPSKYEIGQLPDAILGAPGT